LISSQQAVVDLPGQRDQLILPRRFDRATLVLVQSFQRVAALDVEFRLAAARNFVGSSVKRQTPSTLRGLAVGLRIDRPAGALQARTARAIDADEQGIAEVARISR